RGCWLLRGGVFLERLFGFGGTPAPEVRAGILLTPNRFLSCRKRFFFFGKKILKKIALFLTF
ncbi:hypothetical protein, partial [Leptospira kmetyi]|uniref:hypothetical protein n=1 Tax=Leptospira kmetyi TaxID=408139 RepID=UPI003EC14444